MNLYLFSHNSPIFILDYLGLEYLDLNDIFPGFSDIPGAPNPYIPMPTPGRTIPSERTELYFETITLSVKAAVQDEINTEKDNLKITSKSKALSKCKNKCKEEITSAESINNNFRTYTQMYWSKYSPWYVGNIVVGQVVIKCKLKAKSTCNCKTSKCYSITSGYCSYSDKFDFNLLLFTWDTGISYIGFWEE